MSQNKTRPSDASVEAFLETVVDPVRRGDCRTLLTLMREVTGEQPRMWGPSIVGFGSYHYRYASGREGDWLLTGFSPRKRDLTVYLMSGVDPVSELLEGLGKHKTGKGCLYLKRLSDIDLDVLREVVTESVARTKRSSA